MALPGWGLRGGSGHLLVESSGHNLAPIPGPSDYSQGALAPPPESSSHASAYAGLALPLPIGGTSLP